MPEMRQRITTMGYTTQQIKEKVVAHLKGSLESGIGIGRCTDLALGNYGLSYEHMKSILSEMVAQGVIETKNGWSYGLLDESKINSDPIPQQIEFQLR